MVFAGLYPVESHQYPNCGKLSRNSGSTTPHSSLNPRPRRRSDSGFGAGFSGCCTWRSCRSGSSESSICRLVTTAPGVLYRLTTTDGQVTEIDSPAKLPDAGKIAQVEEPSSPR